MCICTLQPLKPIGLRPSSLSSSPPEPTPVEGYELVLGPRRAANMGRETYPEQSLGPLYGRIKEVRYFAQCYPVKTEADIPSRVS